MNKTLLKSFSIFCIAVLMTSCYTITATVGKGPQTGVEVKKTNHYLIAGLAPVSTVNIAEMTGGAQDYSITITHSFVDGLIAAITGNLYTPTTVIVKK